MLIFGGEDQKFSRSRKALELFDDIKPDLIFCTGAYGESEQSQEYLVANGIPPHKTHRESKSRTTIENYYEFLQEVGSKSWSKVYGITDTFHIPRVRSLSKYLLPVQVTANFPDPQPQEVSIKKAITEIMLETAQTMDLKHYGVDPRYFITFKQYMQNHHPLSGKKKTNTPYSLIMRTFGRHR